MARCTVDSKMLSLYLDWFLHVHALHYVHSASARPHGASVPVQAAGRIDRKHRRVAWVRAVRWRCRPGLAVNMDQIGMYFNKVLISIVSLSGILT